MSNRLFDMNSFTKKKEYTFVFLLSLFLAVLFFLPYVIQDKGYFFYLGDYNCQQIPFNILANEAVKNGNIFWNWNTDLGSNFIGSYAFYLLGSPFFLIQLILPSSVIPMALPWVLCLKFAVSAVTSYLYISRFIKNKNYTLIASLLYAFSSFSIYNIFFNHFHDAIALFPLLLYGLEEFLEKDRKGIFAAMVFLNAMTNYYFFVAEVVFVIIYFFFRLYHGAWPTFSIKKFLALIFESVVGFALSAFIVLPAVLATIQLPRSGNKLSGWALITYFEMHRPLQILQAFFFPPEIPSQLNFYPEAGAKWSSVTAWLPLFGMTGVIAWYSRIRKDWVGKLVPALMFMAFVPPLNAAFQLFSSSYYTRWFYMLVLMSALATAMALQKSSAREWKKGILWTAAISAFIALPLGIIIDPKTEKPLAKYPERLWAYVGIVAFCLISVYLLIFVVRRKSKNFSMVALSLLCVVIVGYANLNMVIARFSGINDTKAYVERNIKGREKIDLPDIDNIRIDVKDGEENSGMFWKIPTIQTFHSIVTGSIIEFYPLIGVERNVASRPKLDHLHLRSFLSVKYLFDGKNDEDEEADVFGFEKIDVQNGFGVWENKNYIPLGFTYDKYVSKEAWMEYSEHTRESVLLETIVLDEKEEKEYSHLFESVDEDYYPDTGNYALEENSNDRKKESAYYFSRDNLGFDSKIKVSKDTLAFYSVPYEKGWSATVNGKKVDIVKSNIGFMSVPVKAGDNEIRFNYMTPGFIEGIIIFILALIMLLIYSIAIPRYLVSEKYLIRKGIRDEKRKMLLDKKKLEKAVDIPEGESNEDLEL